MAASISGDLRKRFESILPKDPLRVVRVVAHNSDGTSTVEDPSGAWSARVMRQTVAVGNMAFVQSGRIIEAAPNLTYQEVQLPPFPV